MESLTLTTSDNVSIAADYYPAEGDRYAILLHMMPASKESWREFATQLQARGITSIAIDQRGHGKSQGGPKGYQKFTDEQQQAKIHDVRAAWQELERRGATPEKTVVVGASIGANLTIAYLVERQAIPIGVALSPGLNYRGVLTDAAITELAEGQEVLLVASQEDKYSFNSSEQLHDKNPDQTQFLPQKNLGHGTTMFEKDPDLLGQVVGWIDERL